MSALRLASVCRAVLRPALSGAPAQRGIAPAQRGIATSSVCMAKDIKTPDSLQASVGIERYEKLCHLAGIEDPWELNFKMGAGTKENPTIVRSMYNKRQIAHICHEDTTAPVIFYVYKGIPTRCSCGHWFKCLDAEEYEFDVPAQLQAQ